MTGITKSEEAMIVWIGIFLAVVIIIGGVYYNATESQRNMARASRDIAAAQRLNERQEFWTGIIDEVSDGLAQGSDIFVSTLAGIVGVCGFPLLVIGAVIYWFRLPREKKLLIMKDIGGGR